MTDIGNILNETQNHGKDNPADQVVEDGGADHHHTKVAAVEVHIHQSFDNHRQGRYRHGDCQKQGKEERADTGLQTKKQRQVPSDQKTDRKGDDNTGYPDLQSYPTLSPYIGEVDLKPGHHKEQGHRHAGDGVKGDGIRPYPGKEKDAELRRDGAEHGGAQQDPGQQLAQHRRLVEPLRQFAQNLGGSEQHPEGEQQEGDIGLKILHMLTKKVVGEIRQGQVGNLGDNVLKVKEIIDE